MLMEILSNLLHKSKEAKRSSSRGGLYRGLKKKVLNLGKHQSNLLEMAYHARKYNFLEKNMKIREIQPKC